MWIMKKNMGVIDVNNRRIKKISIPSIVWVEENRGPTDFLKFISITPSYFSIIYIKYTF
jgi:hypothetical protein